MASFTNDGQFIKAWWLPEDAPYGYDLRANANLGRLLTSSFTGRASRVRTTSPHEAGHSRHVEA
jgi:hypothetical protein